MFYIAANVMVHNQIVSGFKAMNESRSPFACNPVYPSTFACSALAGSALTGSAMAGTVLAGTALAATALTLPYSVSNKSHTSHILLDNKADNTKPVSTIPIDVKTVYHPNTTSNVQNTER